MCGIVGILGPVQTLPDVKGSLRKMMDVMAHRGPDDEGSYIDSGAALGFRRLSIIDLQSGNQPIFNEDKSCVIVFNGEIYNYMELRKGLLERGHLFQTNT